VKLINRLSPDSSLEKVPVHKLLQNFCLEDGMMRGLSEAGAEYLIVRRELCSILLNREIVPTSFNEIACHLGCHKCQLVEQRDKSEGVLNSEFLRHLVKVLSFHAMLVHVVWLTINRANDHTESPSQTRVPF
jgi:hypothetical protein